VVKAVKNPGTPAERTIQLTAKEYKAPQVTASADRTSVQLGERVRLNSNATGSDCSGALSYRWTVDQGRLTSGSNQAAAELDTRRVSRDARAAERYWRRWK
jgi:hypothetical protein